MNNKNLKGFAYTYFIHFHLALLTFLHYKKLYLLLNVTGTLLPNYELSTCTYIYQWQFVDQLTAAIR